MILCDLLLKIIQKSNTFILYPDSYVYNNGFKEFVSSTLALMMLSSSEEVNVINMCVLSAENSG